jgi:hypothetical protein
MVAVAGNVVKIADGRREVTSRFCTALPVLQMDSPQALVWTTSGCASTTSMMSQALAIYFAVKYLGSGAVMRHRLRVFAMQMAHDVATADAVDPQSDGQVGPDGVPDYTYLIAIQNIAATAKSLDNISSYISEC